MTRSNRARWGFGLVLGIPLAAAALTWLLLGAPPDIGCYDDPTPASRDHAIAITAVAAVALMAMIASLSRERTRERRLGRPTAIALLVARLSGRRMTGLSLLARLALLLALPANVTFAWIQATGPFSC